ncbi:hypothetical protein AAG570_008763 [Ranatra chinensis]|uniref:BESS domain-containing protein n=1 Tax=Ranatra chinensis TaxID=642074 RepID=A0ABD0YRY8_9HEMI
MASGEGSPVFRFNSLVPISRPPQVATFGSGLRVKGSAKPRQNNPPKGSKPIRKKRFSKKLPSQSRLLSSPSGKSLLKGVPPELGHDDLLFFKSLLPFVAELPPYRKLVLRNGITNVIMKEVRDVGLRPAASQDMVVR